MARGRGTKSGSSADLVIGVLILFALGWVITHIQLVLLFLVVVGVAVIGVCIVRRYSGKNPNHDKLKQAQSKNAIQAKPMHPRVAPAVSKLESDAAERKDQSDKLDAKIGLIGEAYKVLADDVSQRQLATPKQPGSKQQGRGATNQAKCHTTSEKIATPEIAVPLSLNVANRKKEPDLSEITASAAPSSEPVMVVQNSYGSDKVKLHPDTVTHQTHMTAEELEAKLCQLEEKVKNPYP